MLAARVSLVVGDEVTTQAMVEVIWTDDLSLSTAVVGRLAHYVEQEEGVEAIHDGLAALASGDSETATERLTVAREIAIRTGNIERVSQIERLIDPVTARLHDRLDRADMMELDTRSVKTVRNGS